MDEFIGWLRLHLHKLRFIFHLDHEPILGWTGMKLMFIGCSCGRVFFERRD